MDSINYRNKLVDIITKVVLKNWL